MTEPKKYRKKPVVIEAIRFDGENHDEIIDWVGDGPFVGKGAAIDRARNLLIATLEGPLTASPGDYVIRGVKGEFYPIKPDVFEATYDPVEV